MSKGCKKHFKVFRYVVPYITCEQSLGHYSEKNMKIKKTMVV